MKQIATVVTVDGRQMAEILRPEACEACHACKYGRQERMHMPLPEGKYREGDQVELSLPEGRVGSASLIAYGFPLVMMLIGLFVGNWLLKADWAAALCALAMLLISLMGIKHIEPRLRKSGLFEPTACPCSATKNDQENEEELL